MTNSASDLGGASPLENREIIKLESRKEALDVKAELDALLMSLQLTTPHPPNLGVVGESDSISGILTTIATNEPVTHTQQLLEELNVSREQLTIACTELQALYHRNQAQIDRVDASLLQINGFKSRTQQLAQHSKNQIGKVRIMLSSLEQIRTEIITSLDKFGGYEEIHLLLTQLEAARQTLAIAQEQVATGQDAFYNSLQVIQAQVTSRSNDSEQKLHQYQESIQSLSQTISTDRLRIAGMSVDMSTKINDLHGLNTQITTMHAQIVEKSQILQSRIVEIDRGFVKLSQSVREEKEQFYELTAETIEKADLIQSQLAEIFKHINRERDSNIALKAEVESLRTTVRQEAQQKLINFDLRDRKLISLCNSLQVRQKSQIAISKKFSIWLSILSVVIVAIFILVLRILISLK